MTLKLAILGNTHAHALQAAQDRTPGRWTGVDMTIVATHGAQLLQTRIEDGLLVPTSPEVALALPEEDGLDLEAYDAFAIVGGQVAPSRQMVMLYRGARWPGLPSLFDVPDLAAMPETLIPGEAARAAIIEMVRTEPGPQFARMLRAATEKPIFYLSQPRLNVLGCDGRNGHVRALMRADRSGDGAALADMFDDWVGDALDEDEVIWLPQPGPTLATPLTTRARFAASRKDIVHANAIYGRIVLDQLVQAARSELRAAA